MKIFLIDKYGKYYDLVKKLHKNGIANIEVKNDCNIRLTKNDFVIYVDDNESIEISKTPSIIILTDNKEPNYIWNIANKYNCNDIIDINLDVDYIAKRIANILQKDL